MTEVQSYVHLTGEWDERPVSIIGAVRSLIGQLSYGADITRISMPCVLFKPYSLLEQIGAKNLANINLLLAVAKEDDPLLRILGLGQWLLTSTQQQQFKHKPFNPIIGEVHRARVFHGPDPEDKLNQTYMVVEQVEHHPPTCAVRIDCPASQLSIEGHHTFGANMHRNSISIENKGQAYIRFGDEEYYLPRVMPNLYIYNLILGSRYMAWEGEVTMLCHKTGYRAEFKITSTGKYNTCEGKIYDVVDVTEGDEPYVIMEGVCGGKGTWKYNKKHPKNKKKCKVELAKRDLFEVEEGEEVKPVYPVSQEENSSINIWEEVRKEIVANDMDAADREKIKIEEKQRQYFADLKEKGEQFESKYFKEDNIGVWRIKDNDWWQSYQD